MEFKNPQPKEGINVSPRNHLVDFLVLTIGTVVVITIITFLIGLLSGYLAKRIPYEVEVSLSQPFEDIVKVVESSQNTYLKNLITRLAQCSDLPEGMHIKYHYNDDEMVNAFATLGGNIIVFQGLIDEVDNENQLAMIIAHEIAHIKNRHPIQSMGRGVIVGITLSLLMGNNVTNPLEQAGLLTMLNFSRSMESEADADGLIALEKCYGHVNGSTQVFEKFEKIQQQKNIKQLPFLSTHPLNNDRIKNIKDLASINNWVVDGNLVNFPLDIKSN